MYRIFKLLLQASSLLSWFPGTRTDWRLSDFQHPLKFSVEARSAECLEKSTDSSRRKDVL